MLVVSDTSPLRALQAIEHLRLLEEMYVEAVVPPAVAAELAVDTIGLGPLDVADYPFLVVRSPSPSAQLADLLAEVDQGEAEALALAAELHADLVLIDESKGRRVAARMGLRTTGILALLVEAKRTRRVESVAALLDRLQARISFRISPGLIQRVLQDAGEAPLR